jgi:hypothetical protein
MEEEKFRKKVDEDWKKEARLEKEKEKLESGKEEEQQPRQMPPANFGIFISGLVTEAMIHLGLIENPVSKKKEANLDQARYIIDTLSILQKKTKGNLTDQEKKYLDGALDELKMQYASQVG